MPLQAARSHCPVRSCLHLLFRPHLAATRWSLWISVLHSGRWATKRNPRRPLAENTTQCPVGSHGRPRTRRIHPQLGHYLLRVCVCPLSNLHGGKLIGQRQENGKHDILFNVFVLLAWCGGYSRNTGRSQWAAPRCFN